ncbi:hypothetical protein [Croceicoccus sp. BE223]|nr:hypothetical protein [Croceicoccus sp. BE223]MDR7102332.1 hypothetical protein [Croceicoccus sp. BE223]
MSAILTRSAAASLAALVAVALWAPSVAPPTHYVQATAIAAPVLA